VQANRDTAKNQCFAFVAATARQGRLAEVARRAEHESTREYGGYQRKTDRSDGTHIEPPSDRGAAGIVTQAASHPIGNFFLPSEQTTLLKRDRESR
jgi:hypothetical protein